MSDYVARARANMTPLIDDQCVTFVWFGDHAPRLMGDFNDWNAEKALTLTEIEPGVWVHTLMFPMDAYVEYGFIDGDARVPDPHNPRLVWNGIDDLQQWFRMPDNRINRYLARSIGGEHGTVTRGQVNGENLIIGGSRDVWLYKPPTDEPVPLIVVWDGKDYYKRASLVNIVDNLIAAGRIRPVALIMSENGKQARFIEYFASDVTVYFAVDILFAYAASRIALIDVAAQPGIHGVLGASMGGLMALYTGLRAPEMFGHVITQSGGFHFEVGGREMAIYDVIRANPVMPIKIWQDVGTMEWLLPSNRKMNALLREKGYNVTYREFSAGHNYTAWADQLADALIYQYGV